MDHVQPAGRVCSEPRIGQFDHHFVGGRPQDHLGPFQRDRVAGSGHQLIQQALGIPNAAGSLLRDQRQCFRFNFQLLLGGDPRQPFHDLLPGQQAKVELLAAGFDRHRHLVLFSRGQHKLGVRGWLFQRLQQRVKCRGGEHVHFVDDVNLEAALAGREIDLVAQIANVVDACVRSGINLDQVQEAPLSDCAAIGAPVTRPFGQLLVKAVDRLGQQAGGRGFAGSPGAAEEVGVSRATRSDGVAQGARDVLLADYGVKARRAPLAVKGLRHGVSVALSRGSGNRAGGANPEWEEVVTFNPGPPKIGEGTRPPPPDKGQL